MRVVFFGTPEFAVASLEALLESAHQVVAVVAQPDRPAGRGMKLQSPPVAELATRRDLPLLQPDRIRNDAFLAAMRELDADAGVVVAYGRILPGTLLAIPRFGFINVHGSLLPRWRGAAPIQRAIESGDEVTGVSIMQLDEEMDHGPVFLRRETAIGRDERTPELAARLARLGGDALIETLDRIEAGTIAAVEQDHALATHAAKLDKSEGRIDWSAPARVIYDRFRAFDPWPGLWFERGDERIRVVAMRPSATSGNDPGRIVSVDGGVVVTTGDGDLVLERLQRAGKRPMDGAEVVRALALGEGDLIS